MSRLVTPSALLASTGAPAASNAPTASALYPWLANISAVQPRRFDASARAPAARRWATMGASPRPLAIMSGVEPSSSVTLVRG